MRRLGLVLGLAPLALSVPSANAAVTVGADLTGSPTTGFPAASATFVQTVGATGSFVSPSDGVVVRWRVLNPLSGTMQARVLRTTDGGATFTGIKTGPPDTSPAGGIVPFPLSPGLPIKAGDYFAASQLSTFALSFSNGVPASAELRSFAPALADGANMAPSSPNNIEMLVNADIEPDADNDGFGDESQEGCPKQAGAQVLPCNAFSLGGTKTLAKGKVQIKVNVPGAGTLTAGAASDSHVSAAAATKSPLLKRKKLTRTSIAAGQLKIVLKPSAAGRDLLGEKGKLRVRAKVVYAPTGGGAAASKTLKVKLKA